MSGGKCPTIIGLKLDQTSIAAIKDLKTQTKLAKFVGITISFSILVDMFFSRNVPTVAVNISQHEWELFAESMAGIPKIHRAVVVKEASYQELRSFSNPKQKQFWEAIRYGCSF
jgi:hypothetical protein